MKSCIIPTVLALLVGLFAPLPVCGESSPSIYRLGIELLEKLVDSSLPVSNTLLSPIAVSLQLSSLLEGASGMTYKEIQQVLQLNDTEPEVDEGMVVLNCVSGLAVQSNFTLSSDFVQTIIRKYNVKVLLEDFAEKPEVSTNDLNGWISGQTNQAIPKFFNNSLDSSTILMFISALYFRSAWEVPFQENQDGDNDFYQTGSSVISGPTITVKSTFWYKEFPDGELVSVPFENNTLEMLIFLPNGTETGSGCPNMAKMFSSKPFHFRMSEMESRSVFLKIPVLDLTGSGSLKDPLVELGMNTSFTSGSADFSRICDETPLHLTDIQQKITIKLDGHGVGASAGSGGQMLSGGQHETGSDKTVEMIVNRPFLFMVIQSDDYLPILMGVVNQP